MMKYIVSVLAILLAVTAWFGVKQATAAIQRLEKIEAYYDGEPVKVGEKINLKDISVTAEYYIHDGNSGYTDYVDIKKDYTVSPAEITKSGGESKIIVGINKDSL